MKFFIVDFDWNVVKVCSLQDIVKQYGHVNNYYLILCVYFRRCKPDAPVWLLLSFLYGATAPGGPAPRLCRGFQITLRHAAFGKAVLNE